MLEDFGLITSPKLVVLSALSTFIMTSDFILLSSPVMSDFFALSIMETVHVPLTGPSDNLTKRYRNIFPHENNYNTSSHKVEFCLFCSLSVFSVWINMAGKFITVCCSHILQLLCTNLGLTFPEDKDFVSGTVLGITSPERLKICKKSRK